MPGVRWTRGRLCNKKHRRQQPQVHRKHPAGSLRNGFNGVLRALPGDRALLPPSSMGRTTNLAPASGRQNHTTSPSAKALFVRAMIALQRSRVHRIPLPTSVTIASRPLLFSGTGCADGAADLGVMATPVGLRHIGTTGKMSLSRAARLILSVITPGRCASLEPESISSPSPWLNLRLVAFACPKTLAASGRGATGGRVEHRSRA
jgi:hypothetical protein